MHKLTIQGGRALKGTIKAAGSKNSSLPILFSSILADGPLTLNNTPHLSDISTTLRLLMDMGAEFILESNGALFIDSSKLTNLVADYNLVKTMRASILALGPMLAKYGEAKVSLPGGCAIGSRPVNLHLQALEELGATIEVKNGYIFAKAKKLIGKNIYFDQVSVTATENIVMAATLAEGTTILHNSAKEPEIYDLCTCLNKMGAKISGIGTSTLTIKGVKHLNGIQYSVCPDRIEVGTYLVAAAITKGSITINNAKAESMKSILDKLTEAGAEITVTNNSITLDMKGKNPKAVNIDTNTYPNFPTDMQAQLMVLNAIAPGNSIVVETIFENRFMHVLELQRMGADISLSGNTAYITGVKKLQSAPVMATDLRASAALVLAGLVADGETHIDRIYHIDRGYECIESKLALLGAKVARIET